MSTSLLSTPPQATRDARRDRFRRPLGVLLLVWWALCLGILAWVGPWQSTPEALQADLAAHRVAAWQVSATGRPALELTGGWTASVQRGGVAPYVAWRNTSGRVHWVEGDTLPVPGLQAPPTSSDVTSSDTTSATSPDDGVRVERIMTWLGGQAPMGRWVLPPWTSILVGGLSILSFLAIVVGPRPTRGTRWFWFWFTPLPAGLGIAALALSEYLRPAGPRPATADGRDGRWSGWRGLGYGIVASFLLRVVWEAAQAIGWTPQR